MRELGEVVVEELTDVGVIVWKREEEDQEEEEVDGDCGLCVTEIEG